jgi:two-component system phosphate regulon sensor histidine kinase PhoR
MKSAKWFLHPIFIFVFSMLALGLSLFLYIYWYVEVSVRLQAVIQRFDLDPGQFFNMQTWVVIVVLSVLVGIILVGLFIIFVYNVKTVKLYRLQRNFINSFTHELKTPVTSMQLYLETFKKYELPREDQLKYIDYMLDDVGRLTANVNEILNLAQLEGKMFEGDFVTLDLVRVVGEFGEKNRQLFRKAAITIQKPAEYSFPCRINLPLFEMLLMNLLSNAIKYNEAVSPKIVISFAKQADKLLLFFADNGIGFEKHQAKKIFKKFYQVELPDRPQGEGSGLGLYMVRHIARIHKGQVKAESKGPGKGATFTLILPAASAQGSANDLQRG